MQMPLRYRISSWRQLTKAVSNNSKKLHIHVTDFVQSSRLRGLRVSVDHEDLGTLFAYVLHAAGDIVTPYQNISDQLSAQFLVKELARFGFLVEYAPSKTLRGSQLSFLSTLAQLRFDKIRVMSVWDSTSGVKEFSEHVVVFQASAHSDWLNNGYAPSIQEYTAAVTSGSAIDIGAISQSLDLDWSWLVGWVGNISDILSENAEMSL